MATFGISKIILVVLRNEKWLAWGVKNATGLLRLVPLEADMQAAPWVQTVAIWLDWPMRATASGLVKLAYAAWFLAVLLATVGAWPAFTCALVPDDAHHP